MGKSRDIADGTRYVDASGDTFLGDLTGGTPSTAGAAVRFSNNTNSNEKWAMYGWDDQFQISKRDANWGWAGTYLAVDTSGSVLTPNQPAFRAHTFTPMSGEAPIIFTVAAHNIGSHYNVSNGKFTAPVAGLYHFDFSVLMAANSNTEYVRVLFSVNGVYGQTRNGDTLTGGAAGSFPNYSYHAVQMSHSFYLSANDTVGIINANPNGQTYQSSGGYGSFSGYLVG